MKRELLPSSAFIRIAKRLAKKDRRAAVAIRETLTILSDDAFDPRLSTHKLKGDLTGVWACSAGYDLRILFYFEKHEQAEAIHLLFVGTMEFIELEYPRSAPSS